MPLLRRQVFQREPNDESLSPNHKVFYCEATKEMFKNYEDYIQRIMLINSMVWSCELTGRPNLTYAEALDSEKSARKMVQNYPEEMKIPTLMIAKETKRTSINDMVDDVFNFLNVRYFIGETVHRDIDPKNHRPYTVLEIIHVNPKNNLPAAFKYKIEPQNPKKGSLITITVMGKEIHRARIGRFSKDRLKIFLKQYVDQSGSVVKVKEDIYKKIVEIPKIKWTDIFAGSIPDFEVTKKYEQGLEKDRLSKEKKAAKLKKQESNNNKKQLVQEKSITKSNSKSPNSKSISNLKSSNSSSKQASISKYLTKSDDNTGKKVNGVVKPIITAEEAEKLKKEKEEQMKIQEEARKKKIEDDRIKRIEEQALIRREMLKFNTHNREDLLLQDQLPLPKLKPVETLIPPKYFGDFISILEFVHSFSDVLSIKDTFPNGITMEILERALLLREYSGPLTDIFQVLLSTIFVLQREEDEECEMSYINPQYELQKTNLKESEIAQLHATSAARHIPKFHLGKLHELPMDTNTVSELLRLHLLSSGAKVDEKGTKHKFLNRGGFSSTDDAGLEIRMKYPHIIRSLNQYTVAQLPLDDIMKLLMCLISQIQSYPTFRDAIEERLEQSNRAKMSLRNLMVEERKRKADILKKTKDLKLELEKGKKKELEGFEGTDEEKANQKEELQKLEVKIEAALKHMETANIKDERDYIVKFEKLKQEVFAYQIFLGSDRAYRNYYIFESLPGIFINHDTTISGTCIDTIPEHMPQLRDGSLDDRNRVLREFIRKQFSLDIENKENKIKRHITGTVKINGDLTTNPPSPVPIAEPLSQKDLLMCTTDINDCPVHSQNYPNRQVWSYISTEDEVNALIKSLNPFGLREKVLLDNLEFEKDLILYHIKECPVNKLSIDLSDKSNILDNMVHTMKKYNSLNGVWTKDVNEYVQHALREQIIELYNKVFTSGCLGILKVEDADAWIAALENGSYSMETDELVYGKKKVPIVHMNGDGQIKDENNDDSENEEVANYEDPSTTLGNTLDVESEDSSDEAISVHDSPDLKKAVKDLASALLQIRQGIEMRFLTAPLGLRGNKITEEVSYTIIKNTNRWDRALMGATNFSQIFLHYNILYDSIRWSRAANKAACTLCRRRKDPEKMLLCDKCNCGCHMYCLKPKLKTVPEGDWFCPKCAPPKVDNTPRKRRRRLFSEEEGEQNNDNDTDSEIRKRPTNIKEIEDLIDEINNSEYEVEDTSSLSEDYGDNDESFCMKPKDVPKKKYPYKKKKKTVEDICNAVLGIKKKKIKNEEPKIAAKKRKPNENVKKSENEDTDADTEKEPKKMSKSIKKNKKVISIGESEMLPRSGRNARKKVVEYNDESENDDDSSLDENDDESEDEPLVTKKINRRSSKKTIYTSDTANEYETPPRKQRKRKKHTASDEDIVNDSLVKKSKRSKSLNASNTRKSNLNNVSKSARDRRSHALDNDLPLHNVILYDLLEDISKHKDSWPFNRPVLKQEVPDYYDIITTPMDFAKIKSRLNLGYYSSDYDIMGDIQQIFTNCDIYNTSGTEIFDAGVRLEKFIQKKCLTLNLPFRPSDMALVRD